MKRSPVSSPLRSLSSVTEHKSKRLKSNSYAEKMASSNNTQACYELEVLKTSTSVAQSLEASKEEDKGKSWTKAERRKAKKARKADERSDDSPPRFYYVNSDLSKRSHAIGIGDIRDLVLHLLGEASAQPWLKVENRNAIKKVVTLFVPGISPEHLDIQPPNANVNPNIPMTIPMLKDIQSSSLFSKSSSTPIMVKTLFGGTKEITPSVPLNDSALNKPKLPFVMRTFSHTCPTRAPGDMFRMHSTLSAFFYGPLTADEKRRKAMAAAKASKGFDTTDPMHYIITSVQMQENGYPMPTYMSDSQVSSDGTPSSESSKPGWAETRIPKKDEEGLSPVYSVDCEMCLTEDGNELTRVCLVEFPSGKVLIDRLVKPAKPILDYLTKWSGITERSLDGVTTKLSEVQAEIMSILNSAERKRTPILLGHSLESDLHALKIAHPYCIDTALLYHHPRGRPLKPGLAWLTKKYCGREIQNRGESGHDPEEDALACVELFQKKMFGGPGFGEYKNMTEQESIFDRLSRSTRGSTTGEPGSGEGSKLKSIVVDRGNPSSWHGAGAGKTVACTSDEEVLKGVLQNIDKSDFIWGRLTGLAEALLWIRPKSDSTEALQVRQAAINPYSEQEQEAIASACNTLNAHLSLIHASLPPCTAFILFTGHSDPRHMAALQSQKSAFENAYRAAKEAIALPSGVSWTTKDERELQDAVEHAKKGLLFLCMK